MTQAELMEIKKSGEYSKIILSADEKKITMIERFENGELKTYKGDK